MSDDDATLGVGTSKTIQVRRELSSQVDGALFCDPRNGPRELPQAGKRFEFMHEIARGGMGAVHRVFDRVMQRQVAMKRLIPEHTGARQSLEEAQITGQLEHPNIVPVYDLGTDPEDSSIYYTMRLVTGRSLEQEIAVLHSGDFEPERLAHVLSIVVDVCEALGYAHSRGVIHCDVKPSNVMVGGHGEVYLIDWGLCRVLEGDAARHLDPLIGGSPSYMAPEQVSRDGVDARTDIFGVGALLYRILTGQGPGLGRDLLPAEGFPETAATTHEVRDPREIGVWPSLPGQLCDITMKALALDPKARHASMEELTGELERFLLGGGWFATRRFEAGEHLMREGDDSDAAYLIIRGRCEVYRTADGRRETIRHIGPGEVVGEMTLLNEGLRSANVVALEDGEAQVITQDALERELSSGWMRALVSALAHRFRELDDELRSRGS